jgi:hypothetical protein
VFPVFPRTPTPTAPTAVQALADTHETLFRKLLPVLGVRSIDHSVPFQRSTSVTPRTAEGQWLPTAVQARADVHDTLSRPLPDPPVEPGVCWINQPGAIAIAPLAKTSTQNTATAITNRRTSSRF